VKLQIRFVLLSVSALAIFTVCANLPRIGACPSDSATWCDTMEMAKKCDVLEQCFTHVWRNTSVTMGDDDLVDFALYYETLCPDCKDFSTGQLNTAVGAVGDIMNLTLIPYGNANETWRNETQLWQSSCQHGKDECWGNLLHSCFIHFYPETSAHWPFIHCMESSNQTVYNSSTICAKQFNVSLDDSIKCMGSRLGNDLQHANAVLTNAQHQQYVPWVTLNGVHTEDIEKAAESDLVKLICDTYKGSNVPVACTQKAVIKKKMVGSLHWILQYFIL